MQQYELLYELLRIMGELMWIIAQNVALDSVWRIVIYESITLEIEYQVCLFFIQEFQVGLRFANKMDINHIQRVLIEFNGHWLLKAEI